MSEDNNNSNNVISSFNNDVLYGCFVYAYFYTPADKTVERFNRDFVFDMIAAKNSLFGYEEVLDEAIEKQRIQNDFIEMISFCNDIETPILHYSKIKQRTIQDVVIKDILEKTKLVVPSFEQTFEEKQTRLRTIMRDQGKMRDFELVAKKFKAIMRLFIALNIKQISNEKRLETPFSKREIDDSDTDDDD